MPARRLESPRQSRVVISSGVELVLEWEHGSPLPRSTLKNTIAALTRVLDEVARDERVQHLGQELAGSL